MKRLGILGILAILVFSLSACAAGPNEMLNTENSDGNTAGFWQGVWHGFISFFTFVVSLFNENVNVYEVHNNGGWYNFGFIIGASMFFGGSGGGSCKAASRKRR